MGSKLKIYTDHKNLTFKTFSVQRILRWHLFLDQFDCQLCYIPGKKSVLADCFLRLPQMEKPAAGAKELKGLGRPIDFSKIKVPEDDEEILDGETFLDTARAIVSSITKSHQPLQFESFQVELHECLLNLPSLEVMDNPITINNIVNHQATNLPLQRKVMLDSDFFRHKELEGYEVIHSRTRNDET